MSMGGDVGTVVAATVACRDCTLRVGSPVPVHLPPSWAAGSKVLVVLESPFSDTVNPLEDPRLRQLCRQVPLVLNPAVTYAVSCWFSGEPTDRSIKLCNRHRAQELAVLAPVVVLCVGDVACRQYLAQELHEARGRWWSLGASQVYVVDSIDLSPEDAQVISTAVMGGGA